MRFKMLEANPPSSIEKIQEFEDLLKINFPNYSLHSEYIEFLLKNNGGRADSGEYKLFREDVGGFMINEFLSIEVNIKYLKSLISKEGLDVYYLSLFDDGIYSGICGTDDDGEISIGLRPDNFGKIYYSKLYESIELFKIADSFNEFLNNFE